MSERPIFDYDSQESEKRVPYRPLDIVSDFVVEKMPYILRDLRNHSGSVTDFANTAGYLIAGLPVEKVQSVLSNPHQRDVAALDLKMLEMGIAHSGGTLPENLTSLINVFGPASGQIEAVTYEDLILINHHQDRRTYTEDETGFTEREFYRGHWIIEGHMNTIIANMRAAIAMLSSQGSSGLSNANVMLEQALAKSDWLEIFKKTDDIGAIMKNPHFLVFREYLSTHPTRGFMGPSGAFSAAVPTMDLLLGGENIGDVHWNYLVINRQYFPRQGKIIMDEAMDLVDQGLSLNSINNSLGKPESLTGKLHALSQNLRVFRGKHYKAVDTQLPNVTEGSDTGTSGQSGQFLRDRIDTAHIH